MQLKGILQSSLGGFVCIRGYATLGDLARSSEADMSFQRNLIQEQRERIVEFLNNREYLFFPEVILSYTLKYTYADGSTGIDPLKDILDKKKFTSNVDKISFTSTPKPPKIPPIRPPENPIQIVTVNIPETMLRTKKPFFRIDGNHRLSAAPEQAAFNNYITPFCLILFQDIPTNEAYKRVIFHNINSKSIPLTSEENLKLILDYPDLFKDDTLKEQPFFGVHYYFARKLKDQIDLNVISAVSNAFNLVKPTGEKIEIKRTTLVKLFELLKHKNVITDDDKEVLRTHAAINNVNALYEQYSQLQNSRCFALFIAFVYYELNKTDGDYRASFKEWVLSNHMYELNEIEPQDLISIYNTILSARQRHIFVSMQFSDETTAHNNAIKQAVAAVNTKHKLNLKLKEIRIDELNKGYSYTISDEILELINNTGLLIADLTFSNKNVYHELGFLMGLNSGRKLKQENFILLIKNGGNTDKEVGFNIRDYQQIRFDDTLTLKDKLIESLEIYFKLNVTEPN